MSNIAAMPVKDLLPMNPGVTPCGHRVLVYPLPVEEMSKGGIVIPMELTRRESMAQVEATVMAIGPTCWKDQPGEPWCKVGDKVLIAKYSGLLRIGLDERVYRVISDLDVVGVCDE